MKSGGDNVLKNLRLVDVIAWLSKIHLRDRSYIDQIAGVVEWSSQSSSILLVRLAIRVYVRGIGGADLWIRRMKSDVRIGRKYAQVIHGKIIIIDIGDDGRAVSRCRHSDM